jgi:hypothetical protein
MSCAGLTLEHGEYAQENIVIGQGSRHGRVEKKIKLAILIFLIMFFCQFLRFQGLLLYFHLSAELHP